MSIKCFFKGHIDKNVSQIFVAVVGILHCCNLSRGGSLRDRDEGMSACPAVEPLFVGSWLSWAVEAEEPRGI